MGSSGSNKMGLEPAKPVTTVMGKEVNAGDTIQGSEGFNPEKWEKALSSGKPVTAKDAKDSSFSIPSIGMSPSPMVQFQDYGFSPQLSGDYGQFAPMMDIKSGAIWGDEDNQDSLTQFLEWQKRMGY